MQVKASTFIYGRLREIGGYIEKVKVNEKINFYVNTSTIIP